MAANFTKLPRRRTLPVAVGVWILSLSLALMGTLSATDVRFGNALSFSGASQFVRVPQPFLPTNGNFTIECWVNATVTNGAFRTILSQGQTALSPRFYLGIEPGGTLRVGDNWPAPGVALPSNSWHHLALSRTAGNAFLYLNGVLAATKGSALSNAFTAPFADIGQQYQSNGEFWFGGIDDVRVWNTARSQAEIRATMNRALAGNEANLVAYYRFDASSGTVATNSATATGPALNGSLSNAPAWIASGAVFTMLADATTNVLDGVTNSAPGNVIVGSNAPNTVLILTNGAVLANAGEGLIGITTNATGNRVTVTGSGSVWSNGGSLFVGQSGSFNTLVVSNGARVVGGFGFIGNADGASNNQAIVTGTGSRLELSGFLSVGANGSGRSNSLLVSNGGVVSNAGIGYIGFTSTNSSVTVMGAGSLWTNGSDLRVGESGVGNSLLIANGGRVDNTTGTVGLNAGANSNQVTVRGNGSLWNNGGALVIGNAGSFNSLLVTNGGTVVNTLGTIGLAAGANSNQVILRGADSRWSNTVGLVIGDAGSFNSLLMPAGGAVFSAGNSVLGSAAGANSNEVRLLSPGASWTSGGELVVGAQGAGNFVLVTNGAAITNFGAGSIGRFTSAIGNQLLITGPGSTWNNFGPYVDIGENGSGNSLVLSNGGQAYGNSGYISTFSTASNNLVAVTGTNSLWVNNSATFVGFNGSKATLLISNGGNVVNSNGYVASQPGSRDNQVIVDGPGSQWTASGEWNLGFFGSTSTMTVTNGGALNVAGLASIGRQSGSSNNVALFTGAGSQGNFAQMLLVGDAGAGNQLIISNGAQVSAALNILGNSPVSRSNSALVTGTNSLWTGADGVLVGFEGAGSRLTISNGGRVDGPFGVLGYRTTSSNNSALITGSGAAWTNSESLYVGYDGPGNQLIISNGGRVVSGTAAIGFSSTSTNNSVLLAGANSVWTNSGTLSVGRLGGGSLILNGGTLHAGELLVANGAASQFTFNGGTLVTRGATIANLVDFVVGATSGFPAATWEIAGSTPSSVANNLFVGAGGASGARLLLTNGASLSVDIQSVIGRSATSSNNLAVVGGTGSFWNTRSHIFIGDSGAANTLVITNGGRVENAEGYVGLAPSAVNNRVFVTGSGSEWTNGGVLVVGNSGSSNSLTISGGGVVRARRVRVGLTPNSSNNLITLTGGSLIVNNEQSPNTPAELDVRRGGVVLNGGSITAQRLLLTNGTQSQFTFTAGTLNFREATVANASVFTVGNGTSAATYRMTGALTNTHSFSNGLLLSSNSTLTGNGTITGNVTNFGAILPGADAGALRINGDLRLRPSAGLTFEIGGLIATNDYDRVTVTNLVEFAGTLSLTLIDAFVPGGSDSFTLMQFGLRSGVFANAAHGTRINTTDNLYSFLVSYSATNLVVGGIQPVGSLTGAAADSDGDGMSDDAEIAAGTNPFDADSVLAVKRITCEADGCVRLTVQGAEGRSYVVEYTDDFRTWKPVSGAPLAGFAGGLVEWMDNGSLTGGLPVGQRFYRVRVP